MEDVEYDELPVPDFVFKAVVVGNTGVGKTAFVRRFIQDVYDPDEVPPPTGVKHVEPIMIRVREPYAEDDMLAKLWIWDTSNPHEVEDILRENRFQSHTGLLLCYDINNAESFKELDRWLKLAMRVDRHVTKVVVGLQCDRKSAKRQVLAFEGREFTARHGLKFIKTSSLPFPHFHEASSKTGANVEAAFLGLVYRMMGMAMDLPPRSDKYKLAASTAVSGGLVLEQLSDGEEDWRDRETKEKLPTPRQPTPPPTPRPWPEGPVAAFARDVGKMTLEDFERCLEINACNSLLEHLPAGWPNPPLMEPVWWWEGWGTRWGKEYRPRAQHNWVERYFDRPKEILRKPFVEYFGSSQSDALKEFNVDAEGPSSIADAFKTALSEDGSAAGGPSTASAAGSDAVGDSGPQPTPTPGVSVRMSTPPTGSLASIVVTEPPSTPLAGAGQASSTLSGGGSTRRLRFADEV